MCSENDLQKAHVGSARSRNLLQPAFATGSDGSKWHPKAAKALPYYPQMREILVLVLIFMLVLILILTLIFILIRILRHILTLTLLLSLRMTTAQSGIPMPRSHPPAPKMPEVILHALRENFSPKACATAFPCSHARNSSRRCLQHC